MCILGTRALMVIAMLASGALAAAAEAQEEDPAPEDTPAPDLVERDAEGDVVLRDNATGFGEAGQWTFSTDATLSFERRTQSNTDAVTSISIFPATDYFIMRNLSLGGVIGVGYTRAGDSRANIFRLGPRVGYNLRLSQLLSVWPKLGFAYAHTSTKSESDVPGGGTVTQTTKN